MNLPVIEYAQPLFRPPSEANSLILQITYGCTWNKCAFCEMYTSKNYQTRKTADVINEIHSLKAYAPYVQKIFLADGNPMALSKRRLLEILNEINIVFPNVRRISTYALPGDLNKKSIDDLKQLKDAGLKLLYVGIETGDDELLKLINKPETFDSTVEGLTKAHKAGMKLSVMILTGLGGKKYSEQHAVNSAKVLNKIQPLFASTLVLSFPYGIERYKKRFAGEYITMTVPDLLLELRTLIANTNLNGTIFRSDHASNYIVLKGILSRDKQKFVDKIDTALNFPGEVQLREEWQRGL